MKSQVHLDHEDNNEPFCLESPEKKYFKILIKKENSRFSQNTNFCFLQCPHIIILKNQLGKWLT